MCKFYSLFLQLLLIILSVCSAGSGLEPPYHSPSTPMRVFFLSNQSHCPAHNIDPNIQLSKRNEIKVRSDGRRNNGNEGGRDWVTAPQYFRLLIPRTVIFIRHEKNPPLPLTKKKPRRTHWYVTFMFHGWYFIRRTYCLMIGLQGCAKTGGGEWRAPDDGTRRFLWARHGGKVRYTNGVSFIPVGLPLILIHGTRVLSYYSPAWYLRLETKTVIAWSQASYFYLFLIFAFHFSQGEDLVGRCNAHIIICLL